MCTPTPAMASVSAKTARPFSLYVRREPSGRGVPCLTTPGSATCAATQNAIQPRNTRHASTENNGMFAGGPGNELGRLSSRKHASSLQKNTRP